jgi:hypothetical protein
MPGSRGFLDRFRASGTPGAAAGAGVPADRVAERDVELAGVFEQLAPVEAHAHRTRAGAEERAEERRSAAAAQHQRILAAARRDAEAERRDAAARVTALAERETQQALDAADREATRIAAQSEQLIPPMADQVLARVAERLGVPPELVGRETS